MNVMNQSSNNQRHNSTQTDLLVPVVVLERLKKNTPKILRKLSIVSKSKPSVIGKPPARYRHFAKPITNNKIANSTLTSVLNADSDKGKTEKKSNRRKYIRFASTPKDPDDDEDLNAPVMLAAPDESALNCSIPNLKTATIIGDDVVVSPEVELGCSNLNNDGDEDVDVQLGCSNLISISGVEPQPAKESPRTESANTDRPTRTTINNISVHFDTDSEESTSEDGHVININADTVFINNHFFN